MVLICRAHYYLFIFGYRTASIDVVGTILLVATFRALTTTGATDMTLEIVKTAAASATAT